MVYRYIRVHLYLFCWVIVLWQSVAYSINYWAFSQWQVKCPYIIESSPYYCGVHEERSNCIYPIWQFYTLYYWQQLIHWPVGNWRPGEIPTKELLTLISSWIKNQKKKGIIREGKNPVVPSLLLEEKQSYSEEDDHVKYSYYPTCWRCSQRCQFCIKRKKTFSKFWKFHHGVSTFCCFLYCTYICSDTSTLNKL